MKPKLFAYLLIILTLNTLISYAGWVDADGIKKESINASNTSGSSDKPGICLNSSGYPAIVWSDNTSGNYEIYYLQWNGSAWVDADGSGKESVNISNNSGDSISPSLWLDNNGNPHLAWSDNTSGFYDIYYLSWNGSAWVDADGSGKESVNILPISTGTINFPVTFSANLPSLRLNSAGNPCIAWEEWAYSSSEFSYIFYSKWNGSAWSGVMIVSTGVVSCAPNLCLDTQDNPHITWSDYDPFITTTTQSSIYYEKWDGTKWVDVNGSELWQAAKTTNMAGESYLSSLVLDSSVNPHLVWYSNVSGNWEVYYQKWNGSAWVGINGSTDPTNVWWRYKKCCF